MTVSVPLKTGNGQNLREHWRARDRRVRAERDAIGWAMLNKPRPKLPCVILLRRVAPSTGLDAHDNLPGALKAPVDALASWLGIDDRDPRVRWVYEQRRGPWAVEIEVLPWGAP